MVYVYMCNVHVHGVYVSMVYMYMYVIYTMYIVHCEYVCFVINKDVCVYIPDICSVSNGNGRSLGGAQPRDHR